MFPNRDGVVVVPPPKTKSRSLSESFSESVKTYEKVALLVVVAAVAARHRTNCCLQTAKVVVLVAAAAAAADL